jgi:hypothetical protein
MTDNPTEQAAQSPWRRWANEIATIAQIATLVGVILYGLGRFLAERFYGHFGLSPEDVGLTYAALVWPAAVGGLAFTVILFGAAWIARSLIPPKNSRSKRFVVLFIGIPLTYFMLIRTVRSDASLFTKTFWWCVWYGAQWGVYRGVWKRSNQKDRASRQSMYVLTAVQLLAVPFFISTVVTPIDEVDNLIEDV